MNYKKDTMYARNRHKEAQNKLEKEFSEEHKLWKMAFERWNDLYYCRRCDAAFAPDKGNPIPLSEIKDYL